MGQWRLARTKYNLLFPNSALIDEMHLSSIVWACIVCNSTSVNLWRYRSHLYYRMTVHFELLSLSGYLPPLPWKYPFSQQIHDQHFHGKLHPCSSFSLSSMQYRNRQVYDGQVSSFLRYYSSVLSSAHCHAMLLICTLHSIRLTWFQFLKAHLLAGGGHSAHQCSSSAW